MKTFKVYAEFSDGGPTSMIIKASNKEEAKRKAKIKYQQQPYVVTIYKIEEVEPPTPSF